MDPITVGTAAAGVLGSIFGKKKARNPFQSQINQQTGTLQDTGNTYAGMARTAQTRLNGFQPRADRAVDTQLDYLATDPYTDQVSTRALGTATAGTNAGYEAARASLAANAARRGLSADSSYLSGGEPAIETARAGDFARAENDLALRKIDTRRTNLSEMSRLLLGLADNEQDNLRDATGRQAGTASNLLNFYSGANREANDQAEADYNQQLAGFGQAGSLIGGVFSSPVPTPTRAANPFLSPEGGEASMSDWANRFRRIGRGY